MVLPFVLPFFFVVVVCKRRHVYLSTFVLKNVGKKCVEQLNANPIFFGSRVFVLFTRYE